jgi:putative two-component system response regulator
MTLADPVLGMRILVVDDEPLNVELLADVLADAGFTEVETTTSPAQALRSCALLTPDLLLLDLHMPGSDGFEVMDTLGPAIRTDAGPPVLVLTADVTPASRHRALSAGARDFISKPFDHEEVLLRVRNLLTVRSCERRLADHNERLEQAVRARTRELEASRLEVLDRLALVAEFRDDDTNQHARRVGRSAAAIAVALELAPGLQELLGPAAAMHDVGKIAVPDSILRKPGPLTRDEFAVMQTHTTIGARMLAGSCVPVLRTASTIALTHHERFDGTGYPVGLTGKAIPIAGRIAAVADVFDALTTDRVYRPAFERTVVFEMMREESGKQFDPVVLGALLEGSVGRAASHLVGLTWS